MDSTASTPEVEVPDIIMLEDPGRDDHESSISPRSTPKPQSTSPHRSPQRTNMLPKQKEDLNSTNSTQPRNVSPYERSRLRKMPGSASLQPPPMTRTRSLPSVNTISRPTQYSPSHSPVRPSSPLRSPAATRIYPRRSLDELYPQNTMPSFMDIEKIEEDSELDLSQSRQSLDRDGQSSPFAFPSHSTSHARPHRRRPVSPLYLTQPANTYTSATSPTSASSSPSITPMRYNEAYPPYTSTSFSLSGYSSSMPSTPTSFRSRSPSVSSLETIPDSPDAEDAAAEAYHIASLKAAADAADAAEVETARRGSGSSLDIPRNGWNNSGASRDKRKRWSVCGAERSGTFEMETIWED